MIRKDRLAKMKACAPLLPEPGAEVVGELILEIEECWHWMNDVLTPEINALRAQLAEETDNLAAQVAYTGEIKAQLAALQEEKAQVVRAFRKFIADMEEADCDVWAYEPTSEFDGEISFCIPSFKQDHRVRVNLVSKELARWLSEGK